jgi:hypothetical protein
MDSVLRRTRVEGRPFPSALVRATCRILQTHVCRRVSLFNRHLVNTAAFMERNYRRSLCERSMECMETQIQGPLYYWRCPCGLGCLYLI